MGYPDVVECLFLNLDVGAALTTATRHFRGP